MDNWQPHERTTSGHRKNRLMSKKTQVITQNTPQSNLPTQAQAEGALANMPEWTRELKTKEAMGTTILETNQEMLLVVCDVLIRFFGFDNPATFKANVLDQWERENKPPEIKQFLRFLNPILEGVSEYEQYGADIISSEAVRQVANIVLKVAETRLIKNLLKAGDQEYPMLRGLESLMDEIEGTKFVGAGETIQTIEAPKEDFIEGVFISPPKRNKKSK